MPLWPWFLIVLGLVRLTDQSTDARGGTRGRRSAAWLLFIGAWGLLNEYRLFGLHYGHTWPLLLIGAGVLMVVALDGPDHTPSADSHAVTRALIMVDLQTAAPSSNFRITPQLIVGLLIIFVGVVFTLDELGIAPAISYLRFWPTALIAIGVAKMLQARDGGGAFAGLLFTLVGSWLQAEELNIIHIRIWQIWPLALVLFGGYLVWQGLAAACARRTGECRRAGVVRERGTPASEDRVGLRRSGANR